MSDASLTYRLVKFDRLIAKYEDLQVFGPEIPKGGWCYLGPVAVSPKDREQKGLIVRANVPDALDEIEDWEPVFIDIEGQKFSTWRGVPRNRDKYTVIGHFFVTGIDKPTPEQTANIKAIRNDLISELKADNLIWEKRIPFAALTLWNTLVVVGIYVPTGSFVSVNGDPVGVQIGLLRVNAAALEA